MIERLDELSTNDLIDTWIKADAILAIRPNPEIKKVQDRISEIISERKRNKKEGA